MVFRTTAPNGLSTEDSAHFNCTWVWSAAVGRLVDVEGLGEGAAVVVHPPSRAVLTTRAARTLLTGFIVPQPEPGVDTHNSVCAQIGTSSR
jgi:hypothetical protein